MPDSNNEFTVLATLSAVAEMEILPANPDKEETK